RQGNSVLRSVPTPELRGGNFSDWRSASGVLIPVYDPATTCGTGNNPACANGQTTLRTPFPDNIIPASRFDPTAKILRDIWALPNLSGQPFTHINNFARNSSAGGNSDQINARVDHTFSIRQRVFGRFTRWSNVRLPDDTFLTNTGTDINFGSEQVVLADTYTISPNMVADVRLAGFNFFYNSVPQTTGTDLTKYGMP